MVSSSKERCLLPNSNDISASYCICFSRGVEGGLLGMDSIHVSRIMN